MVRVFALAPETLRRMLRRTLLRFQALVTVSFLAFGLYLASTPGPVRWQIAGPIVAVIALAYFLVIFFNFRQQLRLLYSVRYEVDNSSIVYRQAHQEPLRIMRADISGVIERGDGLWVETVDGAGLLVPYGLSGSGDEEMRGALEGWIGIRQLNRQRHIPVGRLLLIGLGGSLLVLIFANRLEVIVPLGVLALLYGLYTERRVNLQQDSTPGHVRMYNMAFSFLIFVIVMKSCLITLSLLLTGI